MEKLLTTLPATLNADELAVLMGLGRATIYEGLRAGELPGVQVGKRWVISTRRIQALIGCSDDDVAAAIEAAKTGREKATPDA